MSLPLATLVLTALLCLATAHPTHPAEDFYNPSGEWYHRSDSPINKLFYPLRRDSVATLPPSSPNWGSQFPAAFQVPSTLPAAWTAKLKQVTSAPGFPTYGPTALNGGYPLYNGGSLSGADKSVCSFTYGCVASDDVYNAPAGVVGLSFDDGPVAPSQTLYPYLSSNNISATHFMIGSNVLYNPTWFSQAVNEGGHIAVHTWSHKYMTTLTNEQIVGELGWTMEIISNLNWGKVPKFWRPPYGDVDNRVRAIAQGVFGLTTVVWNHDSADWAIGSNPAYTHDNVIATVTGWLTGPKNPGIIMLEHEVSDNTVSVFQAVYPVMKANGWSVKNIADTMSQAWYENSNGPSGSVTPQDVVGGSPSSGNSTTGSPQGAAAVTSGANSTSAASSTSAVSTSASSTSVSTTSVPPSSSSSTSTSTSASAAAAATSKASSAELSATRLGWSGLIGLVLVCGTFVLA